MTDEERERRKAKNRAYYVANKARLLLEMKKWRECNPDRVKELSRAWRAAHPERKRELANEWASRNREKVRAASKAWNAANKERKREASHAHYMANKERRKETKRAWRAANKDRTLETDRAYRERERARIDKRKARWAAENPHKAGEYAERRRGHKLSAPGRGVTTTDIQTITAAQGGRCAHCAKKRKLEADHITPLSRGGEHDPRNIQMLCRACNARKWAHDPMEHARRRGLLL